MASNHTLTVIAPSGLVTFTPGKADLTVLQSKVGGYIATAELVGGIVGYVDDEGLLKSNCEINQLASRLSKHNQVFVGTWAGNLTDKQVEKLTLLIN